MEWRRADLLKPQEDNEPFHLFNKVCPSIRPSTCLSVFVPGCVWLSIELSVVLSRSLSCYKIKTVFAPLSLSLSCFFLVAFVPVI